MRGAAIESPRSHLVFGQRAPTYRRAVRTRDHLYIRTYHPGAFRAEWEQLFDVTHDPHLTSDLLQAQPELATQMRSLLGDWLSQQAGRPGALPDPMQTTLQRGPIYYTDPMVYMHHLRDTGRADQAKDLESRLAVLI